MIKVIKLTLLLVVLIQSKYYTQAQSNNADSSAHKAIEYLYNYHTLEAKTKYDSTISTSLNLLLNYLDESELRHQFVLTKHLIDSVNMKRMIYQLTKYYDTLVMLKHDYSLLRENKNEIEWIIMKNDSLEEVVVDSNFVDRINVILDDIEIDSLFSNIEVSDSLLEKYFMPDSLIHSLEILIDKIESDSIINWVLDLQNDTIDLHIVNVDNDSILLKLYDNNPQIVKLEITDYWGTKIPAIMRDIQSRSVKLLIDDTPELHKVTVEESQMDFTSYSISNNQASLTIQKRPVPVIIKPWTFYGNTNFDFTQIAFHQWNLGGESSISFLFGTEMHINYIKGKRSWSNFFRFKLGVIRQGNYVYDPNAFFKTNEDRIDYLTRYNYEIKKNTFLSFLSNFRSQAASSYEYPTDSTRNLVSRFLSPAYLTISGGTEYRFNSKNIVFFSPLSWKNTMVLDNSIDKTKYGIDSLANIKQEFGMNMMIKNDIKIWDNIRVVSLLELYSNYLYNPFNIDVNWDVDIQMPVNDYIMAKISCSFIYNDDEKVTKKHSDGTIYQGIGWQIKERLSVGLVIKY